MVILDFFKNALNLKNISRQGWIDKLSMEHPESVADHSYSMAIMGMVISDLENYDSEKMLKMILLHDLAESKIGDYPFCWNRRYRHERSSSYHERSGF